MPLLRKPPDVSTRSPRTPHRTQLTTYYRSKNQAVQSPFKKKEPQKNRRKFLLGIADIIILGVLLAGLIYSMMLNPHPKVTANNLSYRIAGAYKSQASISFSELKNRNKITFDEHEVINNMQQQFPEIESVQVELPFFSQEAKVRLIVSPPAFKLISGTQTYIIDSQGIVVAKADSLPGLNNLVTITDQSGYEAAQGKQILSSSAVSFITSVIAQSQHAKVPVASLTLPALAQELDLRTADQPYFVKFYLGGDASLQAGQYLAARQKFAQTHLTPAEYLDVRVSGKIFYK